jgi:serine protease Do
MVNRYLLPACLLGATMVIVASPAFSQSASQPQPAPEPQEIARLAKATVVRIEPTVNSPGSGVIIGRYQEGGKNVYVVLTANHVVQYEDDEYYVVTPLPQGGRQRQRIGISTDKDIERLPGVDLAIVKFRSDRIYKTATIGDSKYITEGALIYVAGFPNPGAAIKKRVFQFTGSLVSSRLDGESVEGDKNTASDQGYTIVYTANTRAGMSGGPVLDASGRVVGIHGQGDRDPGNNGQVSQSGNQESGPSAGTDKTGFNLGIPIEKFLSKRQRNSNRLGLRFDTSAPGVFNVTISIRGGGGRPSVPASIQEEEDAAVENVNDKPAASSKPVPSQPTVPQNTAPAPSQPASGSGRLF